MSVGSGTGVNGTGSGNTTTLTDDILGQATATTSDFVANAISRGATPTLSGSHDLISNNVPSTGSAGSLGRISFRAIRTLAALGSYGGDTQTMELLPSSSAIGAGVASSTGSRPTSAA